MPEALPYIVIVIDELADIMHTYPRELEAAIVRLAQMSRAGKKGGKKSAKKGSKKSSRKSPKRSTKRRATKRAR